MGEVIRFRLKLRSTDKPELREGALMLFPQTRRRALISRAAARMQSLRAKQAEGYLITLLEQLQDELMAARVPESVIEDQLIALAHAIKAKAYPTAAASPGGQE